MFNTLLAGRLTGVCLYLKVLITIAKLKVNFNFSAAVTASGEVYTWGRGNYGRLGHGSSEDCTVPTLITSLKDYHIVDIACGSGDAQTLAVTDTGLVFSWGDGGYGKLGKFPKSAFFFFSLEKFD